MEVNTIDMIPMGMTQVFHVSQRDNNRVIRCDIVDGTSTYTLTGNEALTLRYLKMDGTASAIAIPNTFGTKTYVEIAIPEELTDKVGVVYCKLRINFGGASIGAKAFYILVEGRP